MTTTTRSLWLRLRYGVTARTDWTGGTVLHTRRTLSRAQVDKVVRLHNRPPLMDWWAIGTAAVVGTVGGVLVGVWYR